MDMTTLEVRNISKAFSGHQALSQVSLSVEKGTVFGLLGPNGAGKTSLIRIINQIIAPDAGEILFEGKPLNPTHTDVIGYLPEERGLYRKMKVGEQCMYLAQLKGLSKQESKRRLHEWFSRFDILAWWDKKIEDLSKGMAQKIQFITTVIHEPRLLILDEPFSGFDPINAELIRNEMLRMKEEGTTIILSTHDMGSVEELCDNIALINRSHVILEGPVQQVRRQFRTHLFELEYIGTALEIAIQLGGSYELVETFERSGHLVAHIRLLQDRKLNDLLGALLPVVEILSVRELIPGMEEIFIQAVQSYNAENA